jgi:hypothetical protein
MYRNFIYVKAHLHQEGIKIRTGSRQYAFTCDVGRAFVPLTVFGYNVCLRLQSEFSPRWHMCAFLTKV